MLHLIVSHHHGLTNMECIIIGGKYCLFNKTWHHVAYNVYVQM